MIDAKSLLDQLLGTNLPGGATVGGAVDKAKDYARENPLTAGAAAGGLAAILLGTKTGRSVTTSAATVGGLAVLGGLAYKAFQNWQATGSVTGETAEAPAAEGENPFAMSDEDQQEVGLAMVMAMIAAAKSDGHIDADEQKRIFDKLDEVDLDTEAKAFVMDELRAPLDINRVVERAKNPEMAMQIYTASRVAITAEHPAERAYLETLAERLGLDRGFVRQVEEALAAA